MDVRRVRRWTALGAVLILAAACSDDDTPTAVESNSASTAAASSVPTTAAAPSTTEPPAPTEPSTTATTEPAETTAAATTTEVPAPATTTTPVAPEDLGLAATCEQDGSCISIALSENEALVSYDRSTGRLTFHGAAPEEVMLLPSASENVLRLVAVGPDKVAYFVSQQPETEDPVGYVAAVSTHPDNAGQVVAAGPDIDLSGDSTLFETPTGLVSVGCCGGDRRPALDAPVAISWIDHTGAPVTSDRPEVWIEYPGDGSATFVRPGTSGPTTWTAEDAVTRSMPVLGALGDGGLIVDLTDPFDATSPSRLVRFHPDDDATEVPIAPATVVLVEPAGSVIAVLDGRYVRLRPFG